MSSYQYHLSAKPSKMFTSRNLCYVTRSSRASQHEISPLAWPKPKTNTSESALPQLCSDPRMPLRRVIHYIRQCVKSTQQIPPLGSSLASSGKEKAKDLTMNLIRRSAKTNTILPATWPGAPDGNSGTGDWKVPVWDDAIYRQSSHQ